MLSGTALVFFSAAFLNRASNELLISSSGRPPTGMDVKMTQESFTWPKKSHFEHKLTQGAATISKILPFTRLVALSESIRSQEGTATADKKMSPTVEQRYRKRITSSMSGVFI